MSVSLVIPTLNEDLTDLVHVLGDTLGALHEWTFDVDFIDDSTSELRERARAVLRDAAMPDNVRLRLVAGEHKGKGAAVRRGIEGTRGEVVFVIDADLPAPIACIEEFLRALAAHPEVDVVIAQRPLARGFSSPARFAVSRALLLLQRALVFHSAEFSDTQCGFKAFRGDLIRDIVREQIVDGGMYDLEYLYVARRRGRQVAKVTIVPTPERRESRIDVWRCLRQDPVDLVRFKLHGMLGRYR